MDYIKVNTTHLLFRCLDILCVCVRKLLQWLYTECLLGMSCFTVHVTVNRLPFSPVSHPVHSFTQTPSNSPSLPLSLLMPSIMHQIRFVFLSLSFTVFSSPASLFTPLFFPFSKHFDSFHFVFHLTPPILGVSPLSPTQRSLSCSPFLSPPLSALQYKYAVYRAGDCAPRDCRSCITADFNCDIPWK